MVHSLFIILLVEGFITISIEILAIRQLLPFFGGSVLITSLIIGVFLLFLALGYWRGGINQKNIYQQLKSNFTWAFIWLGFGLSYIVVANYFYLTTMELHFNILLSLASYLLIILAPIVYWLGQTIPLTTNLFNKELHIAAISSQALFLSTIGSFLGAILTSLVLFQYLGVAWTLVINCFLLLLLICFLNAYSQASWWTVVILFSVFAVILNFNAGIEKDLFIKTNNYANYAVEDLPSFAKEFKINESASSLLTSDKKGFAYIGYIQNLLFHQLKLRNKEILIIGAGGFTLTANGSYQNAVTYLDLDPEIKKIAETSFLKESIQGQFKAQDARSFLIQSNQIFDVIISDAYSNIATIPPSLLAVEYFKAIANHLKPKGLFIANIIANPLFADNYSQSIFNSIHEAFPFCTITPIQWNQLANLIYVCAKLENNHLRYTDDKNKATTDFWFLQFQ